MLGFIVRYRVLSGILLAPIGLFLARPCHWAMIAIGALMMTLGLFLRSWAAGHIKKDKVLSMEGPYFIVRNPLYLGSFLMAGGLCLIFTCPSHPIEAAILWALFLFYFSVAYGVKIRQEEQFLSQTFSGQWPGYAAQTPAFIPKLGFQFIPGAGFSWRQWARNKEYNAWIGCAAILLLVFTLNNFRFF
ncbi:MAG: isoprenylcysteine carboxylmethyltransferase family protein [Elusimicrobia bacterium]|nr:isoprenylcysteine carboxylmethyltransferase family protein [Elusimicrobiota bacterium]